jgi:hypothetical protein
MTGKGTWGGSWGEPGSSGTMSCSEAVLVAVAAVKSGVGDVEISRSRDAQPARKTKKSKCVQWRTFISIFLSPVHGVFPSWSRPVGTG